ncbi:MAG: ABC transporter ATP-binding protein [Oscillospiraceae bacterium]
MENIISTERLSVGYSKRIVIEGVDISVRSGEILTIIGPNGAGKSTLLKTLVRQLAPLSGNVAVCGKDIADMSGREFSRNVSALMTERLHTELMTCRDVVAQGRYPHTGRLGLLSEKDNRAADNALELVGAMELADLDIRRISDGQRQRVLLARAICQEPQLLVMDEPTSFLDIRHKLEFFSVLKKLVREREIAVIMSLHELDLAQKISDSVLCVSDGNPDRFGSPEEVFEEQYIRKLFGITNGSFNDKFGSVELSRISGKPQVFVIGGGGAGIPVYRSLQRMGIPFAAGVLGENDIEYPTALALAVTVVSEAAFEPISQQSFDKAAEIMDACPKVICAVEKFGTANALNDKLKQLADGKIVTINDFRKK